MNGRLIAGRYQLTEPLGKGAMGQVWAGQDHGLGGRPVAVKLLNSERMAYDSGTLDPAELRERFERECRVTAQIDHPGLVAVHDAGHDAGELYLVMQVVEGSDLADHLAENSPYPWPWAVAVAAQLCSALVAVHTVHIVHRDLKPGNVMVRPDGRVVVLDLGIAAVRASGDTTRLTRTGSLLGTPVYMAPEQAVGESPVDLRADLYALGVLLYELLTGHAPFEAPEAAGLLYKKLHERPVPPRRIRYEVPAPLEELVLHLLDKEPAGRPVDAHEVYAALAPLLPRTEAGGRELPLDPTRPFRTPMAPWPPRSVPDPRAAPPSAPWPAAPPPRVDLAGTVQEAQRLLAHGRPDRAADLLGGAVASAARAGEDPAVVRALRKQFAALLVDTRQYGRALPEVRRLADEFTAERGPYDPTVQQLRQDEALCRSQLGI